MTYTLTLEQSDVQIIMQALGELPLKVSVATFAKMQQQVTTIDAKNALELKDDA